MSTTYVVKKGDTLAGIAKAHGVMLAALKKANPKIQSPFLIYPGGHVTIPAKPAPKPPVKKPAKANAIVDRAVEKAKSVLHWPHGMCDNFCANMYGHAHSGYNTAAQHWAATPTKYRHTTKTAPKGAIVLYGGGSTGAGHATISLGAGKERSIDMHAGRYTPGDVDTVTRAQVLGWGTLHYLGWIDPFLQGILVTKVS